MVNGRPFGSGARHGEARVWDVYRHVAGPEAMDQYADYARGFNLTNRMPLFVYPAAAAAAAAPAGGPTAATDAGEKKLSVSDVMRVMRTRLEGTWFDTRGVSRPDVGAGSGHSAYRWRPLIWHSSAAANGDGGEDGEGQSEMAADKDAAEYVNERTVATQQTAWNFVAASRPW